MALNLRNVRQAPPRRERDEFDPPNGGIAWRPTSDVRLFVEVMVMGGFSQQAILREFRMRGFPCTDEATLERHFADELAYGLERRVAGYVTKVHTIAMGDTPQALRALIYLLGMKGGPQWRLNREDEKALDRATRDAESGALGSDGVVFYIPENGRDKPDADGPPTIEATARHLDPSPYDPRANETE